MDLSERSQITIEVEAYLKAQEGWVPASELCARFGLRERELRAESGTPGVCTNIAISGKRGFRHIATCTLREWEEFRLALNTHAESERSRVMTLTRKRELSAAAAEVRAGLAEPESAEVQS